MADQNTITDSHNSKITKIVLPSTQHSCPTAPTRFFRSLNKLTLHNAPNHPPSPIHSPSTTNQPSPTPTNTLDIGTSIFYADSENGLHNLWHLGIPFILRNTDHHPPNFWNTWRCHLKHRSRSNFLRLQAHTIQAITNKYALSIDSTPFWWLLFNLDSPPPPNDPTNLFKHTSINFYFNLLNLLEQTYTRPPTPWAAWVHLIHAVGGASSSTTMGMVL